MKIYLLPGLGYDDRIFANLDFKDHQVTYLNWIEPKCQEGIAEYAVRMLGNKANADDRMVLIGHSFGAIIAQEIAAIRNVEKVILLSSIKSRKELPTWFQWVAPLKLHHLFTKELSIKTVKYWGKHHDISSEQDQELFKSMLRKQSNTYLQWALRALSVWKAPILPTETTLFQIHGTNDQTFPIQLIENPDIVIQGGSHIMCYKQAKELNDILLQAINT